MRQMLARLILVTALVAVGSAAAAPVDAAGAKHYANCKALNARYPHGVGLSGAVDRTSGRRVTNFTRNRLVYLANRSLDRDKDKVACEKR
jgi:hypothetical protein